MPRKKQESGQWSVALVLDGHRERRALDRRRTSDRLDRRLGSAVGQAEGEAADGGVAFENRPDLLEESVERSITRRGDGLLDAVTSNSSTSTAGVLLAVAPGVLSNAVTYPVGSFPLAIDLADLDGDGDLDMVTSNFSGGSYSFYRNDGDGVFGGRRDLPAAAAGSCAVVYDLDGDGDLDFGGIDEVANHVRLYRNE